MNKYLVLFVLYIILYAGYTKLYEYRGPIETSATIRVDVDTNNISLYYDTAAIDPLSLTSSQLVFQGTHSLTETNRILGIGNWSEGASFKYTRFDNIKLTEVPEPITFGMFGLGTIVVLIKTAEILNVVLKLLYSGLSINRLYSKA